MPLDPPDIKELKAIVEWVQLTSDIREVTLRYGEVELHVSRNRQVVTHAAPLAAAASETAAVPVAAAVPPAAAPVDAAPAAPAAAADEEPTAGEVMVTAPMVGTFYAAPKPGAAPFVEVGSRVEPGTVLCIVEVMKLMNTVEAPTSGTIRRILVANGETIEFGQPIMTIEPDA